MPESRELNDMIEVRILDTATVETTALKDLANELIEEVRFVSGKAKAHPLSAMDCVSRPIDEA